MLKAIRQSVGIDVSKSTFDVCVIQLNVLSNELKKLASKSFANTAKGFTQFSAWVNKYTDASMVVYYCMEATGVYHEQLAEQLYHEGKHVSIVLANKIKAFGLSFNQRSKTDSIDAEIIARFAVERPQDKWQPISKEMSYIRSLSRQRQAFVKERTVMKNRLHAAKSGKDQYVIVIRNYEKIIIQLNQVIVKLDKEIRKMVKRDKKLSTMTNRVQTIPGVGVVTAVTVLAETDGFQLFTRRSQLIKFAGLDVVEKQSGTSIKGKSRISKAGNSTIRHVLYMAAMTAIRKDGPMKDFYERIVDKTKVKKKGLVAVERKLLTLMYALTKTETDYIEDYHLKRGGQVETCPQCIQPAEQVLLEVQS